MNKNGTSQRGGETVLRDHLPDAFGRAFLEMKRHERKALGISAEQGTAERLRRRTDITEAQLAFFTGGGAYDASADFIDLLEQYGGFAKQDCASGRNPHHVARAFEQRDAQGMFQLLNRAA